MYLKNSKHLIIIILLCYASSLYSQQSEAVSFEQFIYKEPKIERPYTYQLPSNIEAYPLHDFQIKSMLTNNELTSYDSLGRIKSQVIKESTRKKTTLYIYENDILIQKKIIIEANKQNANRQNNAARLEAEKDTEMSTYEWNDTNNYLILHTAEVNANKQIIAHTKTEYKTYQNKKKRISETQYKVTYTPEGHLKTIESLKETIYFSFKNGLLVQKEVWKAGPYQDVKEIYNYLYDNNKNLVSIKKTAVYGKGERIDAQSTTLLDSATYDNKNRIVKKSIYEGYILYKYDENNNITQYQFFQKPNELFEQNDYTYNNQNQLKTFKNSFYKNNKLNYYQNYTFSYKDTMLKEIVFTSSFHNNTPQKILYQYDEKKQLVSINIYNLKNMEDQYGEIKKEIMYQLKDKKLEIIVNYSVESVITFY